MRDAQRICGCEAYIGGDHRRGRKTRRAPTPSKRKTRPTIILSERRRRTWLLLDAYALNGLADGGRNSEDLDPTVSLTLQWAMARRRSQTAATISTELGQGWPILRKRITANRPLCLIRHARMNQRLQTHARGPALLTCTAQSSATCPHPASSPRHSLPSAPA